MPAERAEQVDDAAEPVDEQPEYRADLHLERQLDADRPQVGLQLLRIEEALDRCVQQGLLVAERAEDGALGDAAGLGDLAGRDVPALCDDQRDHDGEDHVPPVLDRERTSPAALETLDVNHHRPIVTE